MAMDGYASERWKRFYKCLQRLSGQTVTAPGSQARPLMGRATPLTLRRVVFKNIKTGETVELKRARIYYGRIVDQNTGEIYMLDEWESVNPDGDFKSSYTIRNE